MAQHRVTKLDNAYTRVREQQGQFNRSYRTQVHLRRAALIGGVFMIITLILGFQLWSAHRQLNRVDAQISTAQTTLKHKQAQNAKLSKQNRLLKDPTYLQELLREKYNFAKKGEIIYNFVK